MKRHLLPFFPLVLLASACGGRTPVDVMSCQGEPLPCIVEASGCDAQRSVTATCDTASQTWSCPSGSRAYASVTPGTTATCLPFHEQGGPITQLGGSLARIPIDGGRCLWIAETVQTRAGAALRNVGFLPDKTAAFGSCPARASYLAGAPSSAVTLETDDPSLVVQIDGGFRLGGRTHVLYRLFRLDPTRVFGLAYLGSGLGTWDETEQRIVVPGPSSIEWAPELGLGDASLTLDGNALVWGCHGPDGFLTSACKLAVVGGTGETILFAGNDQWVPGTEIARAKTVFASGPWISSVTARPGGAFLHVYAIGFGTTLETHTAESFTGPWSSGPSIASCDLPAADPKSFCAGPIVHEELADPTVPGQLVVSYGIGTTAKNQPVAGTDAESYWTRLVWTTAP